MSRVVGFHVMAERCGQCLMDPANRIVPARRAAEILRETKAADTKFICHKSQDIACRGHHDAMPCRAARFAAHLGIPLIEHDPETLAVVRIGGEPPQ